MQVGSGGSAAWLSEFPRRPSRGVLYKSGANADRTDARLSSIEATVDRMDTRFRRVEEQLDGLNGRIDDTNGRLDGINTRIDNRFTSFRRNMRRWLYLLLFAISFIVTIISAITQLLVVG